MNEQNFSNLTLIARLADFFDEVQIIDEEDIAVSAKGAELLSSICSEYIHIGEGSADVVKYCNDVVASSAKSGIPKSYLVYLDLVMKVQETDHPLVMYSTIMMIAPILYRYLRQEGKI